MKISDELIEHIRRVKLLLMDCDGVLTDGRLYFTSSGEEMKVFDVKDGQGLALWHDAGFASGIISGRGSAEIIGPRANEIGIQYVATGSINKVADLQHILAKAGLTANEVAYVGDDVGDLGVMELVGFPVAVADAVEAVRSKARYVTSACGGRGAVREVVDMLLYAGSI